MKINLFRLPRKYARQGKQIARIARAVTSREDMGLAELNIVFVDNRYMRGLNYRFLRRNRTTDVLSFLLETDYGEIYIARPQLENYEHLKELLIHGLLHLAGLDHTRSSDKRVMLGKTADYMHETD